MTQVLANPNAYIAFTDGVGSAALPTTLPIFENWLPDGEDIGTATVAMATGQTFKFIYRTDYTASFDITHIPAVEMSVALRLKQWLESGGTVVVVTQDLYDATYTCWLKPGAKCALKYDRKNVEYTLSLSLLNTVAAPMLCQYQNQLGVLYTITVTPSALVMLAGVNPLTLTAVVTDATGNTVVIPVTWQSTNQGIAQVDQNGNVTSIAPGQASILVSAGGTQVIIPITVTVNQMASSVVLSPSPMAFTATTYAGTPQVGVSGVAAQVMTAVVRNTDGTVLPYTAGMLAWSSDNANVPVTDNGNGTAMIGPPKAGGQTANITAKVVLTPSATATAQATTVPSVGAGVVPSSGSVVLTAPGQQTDITFTTVDQYGGIVP